MPTSGSYNFNLTRNQIIQIALRRVGGLALGQLPTNEQYAAASDVLNMMVDNWRAEEIFIWAMDYITIPMVASTVVLGTDGNNYECIRNHTSSLTNKPITGADTNTFWVQTTSDVTTVWAVDEEYTSICNYTLDDNIVGLEDFKINYATSPIATAQIIPMSREQYSQLTNITVSGRPTQYFFFRQDTPSVFLYPYPDSTTYSLQGYVYRYPQNFNTGADYPSFLKEWLLPLSLGLAVLIAPEYGVFGETLRDLTIQADKAKEIARMLDHENGDLSFWPNPRRAS